MIVIINITMIMKLLSYRMRIGGGGVLSSGSHSGMQVMAFRDIV